MRPINVGMAQIASLGPKDQGVAILGSCIGLVLFSPESHDATMGHIVLPFRRDSKDPLGKFSDSAVPEMLRQLRAKVGQHHPISAKLAGGASMFHKSGPLQIGSENARAVKELLKSHRIPIMGEHLGGTKGRRVVFDCDSCRFTVDIQGQQTEAV